MVWYIHAQKCNQQNHNHLVTLTLMVVYTIIISAETFSLNS